MVAALLTATMIAGACRRAKLPPNSPPSNTPPMAEIRYPTRDSTHADLLSMQRLERLPAAQENAWFTYLDRSALFRLEDRLTVIEELRKNGKSGLVRAPDVRASFKVQDHMTTAWFATDSARALADVILTYQAPNGGWSKHVDYSKGPRQPGTSYFSESDRWTYISTIDNGATTEQLRFLAKAITTRDDARYHQAFNRGIDYLVRAQFPNGCWPQVYPLEGSYHDAATFNDDATVNVLKVLRDVGRGERAGFGFVDSTKRALATAALERGVQCLVAAQVVVDGKKTAWGQQHDPLTLEPIKARSYEPAALSGRESAGIVEFLMGLPSPDASVVDAVHSAVDWFKATAIRDLVYEYGKGIRREAGAGPLWARMTEIGTNRPIFSNRDGIKLYDFEQLTDRRTGYGWFSSEPADVLARYDRWAARYPRTGKSE